MKEKRRQLPREPEADWDQGRSSLGTNFQGPHLINLTFMGDILFKPSKEGGKRTVIHILVSLFGIIINTLW